MSMLVYLVIGLFFAYAIVSRKMNEIETTKQDDIIAFILITLFYPIFIVFLIVISVYFSLLKNTLEE